MPVKKASFIRISGMDAASAPALAGRLKKVSFGINSDVHVVAVDSDRDNLGVELALRREIDGQTFDTATNKFVGEKRYEYRQHHFNLNTDSFLASTPGGKRDFKLLIEQLRRCGAAGAEVVDLQVNLLDWTRAFLKMYETAQFGAVVIDDYFSEPRMIGRYTAKSVDNRLDISFLEQFAGQLRSIRFSVFVDGTRRSVEARRDMVLSVTSGEDDELESFFEEQEKLLRQHSGVREDETDV